MNSKRTQTMLKKAVGYSFVLGIAATLGLVVAASRPAADERSNLAPAAEPSPLHPKVHPSLQFRLGEEDVIVSVLEPNGDIPAVPDLLEQAMDLVGREKIKETAANFAFSASLTKEVVLQLADRESVHFIEPDLVYRTSLLPDAIQIVNAVETWAMQVGGMNLTGEGQTVAIIDTGIDFTHPDLAAKNIVGCNMNCSEGFCFSDCSITDCNGHGTHVAGIAGADGGISGIGPGVNLIALKVFPDCFGSGAIGLSIVNAIFWCYQNADKYNIAVISISLGTTVLYEDHCVAGSMNSAINLATENGIACVVGAGNGGSTTAISSPACAENAIPVAATDKDDMLWPSSNYNSLVKVFAPGADIQSTFLGGGYGLASGTSMSTPMVSAAIAIMRQYLDAVGASLTPLEMEQVLFDTADAIVDLPFSDWRRINIESAILALVAQFPPCPTDINGDGSTNVLDLIDILLCFGQPAVPGCEAEDVNGDGTVNVLDLIELLLAFGQACP